MALAVSALSLSASTSNTATYVITLSRAVTANGLALLAISGSDDALVNAPAISGGGLTWELVAHHDYKNLVAAFRSVSLFRAMGAAPSGTSLTATFDQAIQSAIWAVDEWTGALPGNNGASAIAQTATGADEVESNTATPTLGGALSRATCAMYAVVSQQREEAMAPGDSATEIGEATIASNAMRQGTYYKVNDTSFPVTWTTSGFYGWIAVEILDAAISAAGSITPSGALFKATTKSFAGSITPTGALTKALALVRSFAGSITPSGSLVKATTKLFTGSITPAGSLVALKIRHLLSAITEGVLSLTGRSEGSLTLTEIDENSLTLTELEEEDA